MISTQALNNEAGRYQAFSEELKRAYKDIDEETLADTLEGLSDLPDLLKGVLRSSLEDEGLVEALKVRLGDMQERLGRLRLRAQRKRDLAGEIMERAGVAKLTAPDFSASLRTSPVKAEIFDEAKLPEIFFTPQPPKLDRVGLMAALKQGVPLDGARLVSGGMHLQVRTK